MSSTYFRIIRTSGFLEDQLKILHEHIRAFLILCEVISHEDVFIDAFFTALFSSYFKRKRTRIVTQFERTSATTGEEVIFGGSIAKYITKTGDAI